MTRAGRQCRRRAGHPARA